MQAPGFEGFSFDLLSLFQSGFVTAEVDICWRDVVQALVVALVIVVIDESLDLSLEITWQKVVFQQNAVLQGLMPPFHCPAVAACSDEYPYWSSGIFIPFPTVAQQCICHDDELAHDCCDGQFLAFSG